MGRWPEVCVVDSGNWLVEGQRREHTQRIWVFMPLMRPAELEPMGGRKRWNWELAGGGAEARAHAMEL